MSHTQARHFHIRWSSKATLDWERFSTSAEAEASAKQLVRLGETYAIEEHDGACTRCQQAMKPKSAPSTSKGASGLESYTFD
jgi:hypothetical protein